MFCLKFLLILNYTNTVLSKMTFRNIFLSKDGVLKAKEIRRLGLEKNPRLWLDSW
jgi:hypothetical protein